MRKQTKNERIAELERKLEQEKRMSIYAIEVLAGLSVEFASPFRSSVRALVRDRVCKKSFR